MRARSIAAALLLTLAPCALVTPAFAQQDDATTIDARARFLEGVELFDKGQFEKARAKFLQAYALKRHPDVLLNLAMSCLKANHAGEAERHFQQFLREDGKDAAPAKRAQAEKGLADARAKLGRIEISAPAGTDVMVDNDRLGTAPFTEPVHVEPGPHAVKFKGVDGTTETQNVTVAAGQSANAQFSKTAAPVAPVPPPVAAAPAPSPAPAATEPSPATPGATAQASMSADSGTTPRKRGILSPPENMVPVYIGLGVAGAGFITAIAMAIVKDSAQSNATEVENKIKAEANKENRSSSGICNSQSAADQQKYGKACAALRENNDAVDTDAAIGNVALGVGIVASAGTVLYYLFAPKKDATATAARPLLVPSVGTKFGGLSIVGTF